MHIESYEICCLVFNYTGSEIPSCLYGSTCFCDNLEDEWLIVYLLFSISRLYTQLVIRSVQPDSVILIRILKKLRNSHPGPCKAAALIRSFELF